jgi:hypothetical protein
VVGAIERQVKVLGSKAPDDQRLNALKYVVHFVGDVHQPLHAGYQNDRAGSTYQLQAFGRGTNLHAVWDSGLIKSMNEDADAMAARFAGKGAAGSWTPAQAAEESCQITTKPGFYPGRLLDAAYVEKFTPVVDEGLGLAGSKLAEVLNRVLR